MDTGFDNRYLEVRISGRRCGVMSRTREFCVHDALSKALQVFWRSGFEGSTLSDLTEAMGITRPSLYATYGNKEELFRKALDLYDETYLGFTREALGEGTARGVAQRLLSGFAMAQTDSKHPPGCLGTTGALACSAAVEPIRQELVRRRVAFEANLRRRLEAAKDAGDLPADSEPADLARFLMTVAAGMSVQAMSGATREALHRVVATSMRAWPESSEKPFRGLDTYRSV